MLKYIIHDLDDSIIAESFDRAFCVNAFMNRHPAWFGDVDSFLYEVDIHFDECPQSEYNGLLSQQNVLTYNKFKRMMASTNKLYALLCLEDMRITLNR